MKNEEYISIDDHWFEKISSSLDINKDTILKGPAEARNILFSSRSDRFDLDMSHIGGCSLFDLLNLFLFIDYAQATKATVYIKMPFSDLSEYEFNKSFFKISKFNELNKGNDYQKLGYEDQIKFKRSKYIYRFLSFCYNFGFFDAIKLLTLANQLYFDKCNDDNCRIDDSFLSQLFQYRGARSYGSKVFGLLPIYKIEDTYNFRNGSIIENWTKSLNEDIQSFPIFKDGEFARVFGYQLAMNIGEHAGKDYRGEYGALGALAMRVLPPRFEEGDWLSSSFPDSMQHVFLRPENSKGVLEICVGDRGIGIVKNLKKTLQSYYSRFGVDKNINDIDVLSFAFDELGTTKPLEKRTGGVHALHRILKCVTKYQGVMRIRSNGKELIYAPTLEKGAFRNKTNFGIYTDFSKDVIHPFGVQIQILIPLAAPIVDKSINLSRKAKYEPKSIEPYPIRVVPLSTFMKINQQDEVIPNLLIKISNDLMEEPSNKTIVLDFSGTNWIDDDIALIFTHLKRVLHTHKCIGVNLESGIARLLRDRELNESPSNLRGADQLRSFFDILSSKHRLLPILDNSQELWWFGLGTHQLDNVLRDLFLSDIPITKEKIEQYSLVSSEDLNEIMKIYLGANNDFLSYRTSDSPGWICNISISDFNYALSVVIHTKFEEIIGKFKCIEKKGFYKLPSRRDFSSAFFQSTVLLQDNVISRQIGEWAAFAIRLKLLDKEIDELLLVCATAPAELFAKIISDSLSDYFCHIVNLGHYSSLDKERYLAKGEWSFPAFIITDVIDSGNTVKHIITELELNHIIVEGLISMVMFYDDTSIKKYKEYYWDKVQFSNEPTGILDVFFLYKMLRPETVSDDVIFNKANSDFNDDKLLLIEPFSLEIFKYTNLSQSKHLNAPKSEKNSKRIEAIEKLGAIRAGHWVYGSHHFLVTTCIVDMLRDDTIGGEICHEIVEICINNKIDHILLPLHSQISFILPRIISSLKLLASMDVDYTLCLSTRVITEQGFYVLPNKLKELIKAYSSKERGLRILIIDDAIASGRTLETILRALVLNSRNYSKGGISPIDYIHAYSILDRQGRARGTQLTGISKFKLYGDGEWMPSESGSYEVDFNYERWVDVDMPVKTKETCPYCSERRDLLSQTEMLSSLPEEHSILLLINERIEKLKPYFLDSPKFVEAEERPLPWPVHIGQHKAETVELALWEFYNLLYRGCPIIYFIKWLDEFDGFKEEDKDYPQDVLNNLTELKSEIIRQLFRNWERLTSQWAGYQFENYLLKEFDKNKNIPVLILAEAGAAFGKATAARKILKNLFVAALQKLMLTKKEDDLALELRSCFAMGCKLFSINYVFYTMMTKSKNDYSNEGYINIQKEIVKIDPKHGKTTYAKLEIEEIIRLSKNIYHGTDFIAHFREVLIQTVRPGRHRHSHLLISRLLKIANGTVVLKDEKRLIRDSILIFLHSFKITLESCPRIISLADRPIYEEFRQNLDLFQSKLIDSWENDKPPYSVQCLASEIANRFPYQVNNRIYRALCETQVSIRTLIKYIKSGCEERGYDVHFEIGDGLDDLYIMAPNESDLLEGIIKNYTFDEDVASDHCPRPHLYIKVFNDVENAEIIGIEIYSNFRPYNKANISTGWGKIELSNPDYYKFRVNLKHAPVSDEILGGKYQTKILIQFIIGVKVK